MSATPMPSVVDDESRRTAEYELSTDGNTKGKRRPSAVPVNQPDVLRNLQMLSSNGLPAQLLSSVIARLGDVDPITFARTLQTPCTTSSRHRLHQMTNGGG